MDKKKKLKPGNEVAFNTDAFNQMGFRQGTIYIVDEVIDNVRVTLTDYPKNIIDKKYLKIVKEDE